MQNLLTANRFDKIKTAIGKWAAMQLKDLTLGDMGEMLTSLQELSAEIDRTRSIPQARPGSGSHIKPVLFDPQGKPLVPAPLVQQFAAERREQYALDRHVALMMMTTDEWRKFALRWGLSPPPGGWDDVETVLNMMHRLRLDVVTIPVLEKHISAVHCTSKGIALPARTRIEGGQFIDDRVVGHADDQQ